MALLEQAHGAYLTAALPALVIEPHGGHLGILGELVAADIVDDLQSWHPEDVVDAEVVEETSPAADRPVATAGGGRYRPGRSMARFVQYRDLMCRAAGCRRRAEACDLDHIVRHPMGPTCPCNLHALCRRHHRMKHLSGATVVRRPTGETVWTMPTGHVVTRPPTPPLQCPLVRRRPGGQDTPTRRSPWATADLDRAAGGLGALSAAVEGGQQAVAEPGTTQSWADGEPPF